MKGKIIKYFISSFFVCFNAGLSSHNLMATWEFKLLYPLAKTSLINSSNFILLESENN